MLMLGHLLKAAGMLIAGVAVANAVGLVLNIYGNHDPSVEPMAFFALPIALGGCVPGGLLYWLGRRIVRKHPPTA